MDSDGKGTAICVVHDYARRISRHLDKLKTEKSYNSKKILEYYKSLLNRNLAFATQEKYLDKLPRIFEWLKKDVNKASKKDIEELVEKHIMENSNLSNNTKRDYKMIIKIFWQWLKNYEKGKYPPEVNWIKCGKESNNLPEPENMLTEEDIARMIKVVEHPRDKAFIITLAESGCRIGEILTLQIGNLNFDDRGCYFIVNGKTGKRRVRVVNSTPYLQTWKDHHPEKENKEAPLWCNIGTTKNICRNGNTKDYKFNWSFHMTYAGARNILIRAGRKAGIEKPINPHNFRHSRATILGARGINESIMNQVMGWKQGSNMAGTYIHLSGKQTDDALLPAVYGMEVEEQKERNPKMFPIKCMKCGELNSYDAKRCKTCSTIVGVLTEQDITDNSATIEMQKDIQYLKDIVIKWAGERKTPRTINPGTEQQQIVSISGVQPYGSKFIPIEE